MLDRVKGFIAGIVTAGVVARKIKAKIAAINDDTDIDEDKKPQIENMKELGGVIISDARMLFVKCAKFYGLAQDLFLHVLNAEEK